MTRIKRVALAVPLFGAALFSFACGGSSNPSPQAKAEDPPPERAAPEVSVSEDPWVARILSLGDDCANVVKTAAKEFSKIVDDDTALAAGKELKKGAERIRGLSKELKSVGKIAKRQNPRQAAFYAAVAGSGLADAKAMAELSRKYESVKLSAEAAKALGEGMSEFNNAMLEFNKAISEIKETKQGVVP
jgi:hypothetical protein